MDEACYFDCHDEIPINRAGMWRGLFVGHQNDATRNGKPNAFYYVGDYYLPWTNRDGEEYEIRVIVQPTIFDSTIDRTAVLSIRVLDADTGDQLAYGGAQAEWVPITSESDLTGNILMPDFIRYNFGWTQEATDLRMNEHDFDTILTDVAQSMDMPHDTPDCDSDDDSEDDMYAY